MTAKELAEMLLRLPPDMELVFRWMEWSGDYLQTNEARDVRVRPGGVLELDEIESDV